MTTTELKIFVEAMRHLVANSFLGGYTQTKTVKDLIFGFEISPATLDWFKMGQERGGIQGLFKPSATVTPIMNNWEGPTADIKYTMFTGNTDRDHAGMITSTTNTAYATYPLQLQNLDLTYTTVQWYNEDFGKPQKFYNSTDSPADVIGWKLPISVGPEQKIGAMTKQWETRNQSPFELQNMREKDYCLSMQHDICWQNGTISTWERQGATLQAIYRDQPTFEMPVAVVNNENDHVYKVDKATGIILQDITSVSHQFNFNKFFFPDYQITSLISRVTHNITVNPETYINEMYPHNGTHSMEIGTKIVLSNKDVFNTALIIVFSLLMLLGLIMMCGFFSRMRGEDPVSEDASAMLYGRDKDEESAKIVTTADIQNVEGLDAANEKNLQRRETVELDRE